MRRSRLTSPLIHNEAEGAGSISTSNFATASSSLKEKTRGIASSYCLVAGIAFFAGCLVVPSIRLMKMNYDFCTSLLSSSSSPNTTSTACRISLGTYRGSEYTSRRSTVGTPTCLIESKFLKVQLHHVQLLEASTAAVTNARSPKRRSSRHPNHYHIDDKNIKYNNLLRSRNGNFNGNGNPPAIIPDWIWIDYHDRVNVLVQLAPTFSSSSSSSSPSLLFLVLEQTKYALEDRTSYAVVGGIIEPGEYPVQAARREVQEELHVVCNNNNKHHHHHHPPLLSNDDDFNLFPLGRYRTDVNRGMGWTHAFLASNCSRRPINDMNDRPLEKNEVGVPDLERQDVKILTLQELQEAVQNGRFLEIQWSATVALALLHLQNRT